MRGKNQQRNQEQVKLLYAARGAGPCSQQTKYLSRYLLKGNCWSLAWSLVPTSTPLTYSRQFSPPRYLIPAFWKTICLLTRQSNNRGHKYWLFKQKHTFGKLNILQFRHVSSTTVFPGDHVGDQVQLLCAPTVEAGLAWVWLKLMSVSMWLAFKREEK